MKKSTKKKTTQAMFDFISEKALNNNSSEKPDFVCEEPNNKEKESSIVNLSIIDDPDSKTINHVIESEPAKDVLPRVFTVSEINNSVKDFIETSFSSLWISGEISTFQKRDNGFFYFTLKDDKCQISAIMFPKHARSIAFKLENGLEVNCHGKLSLYPQSGKYQIVVDLLEPKGKGALQKAFEQLKEKLSKEGLFAVERKRPIPFFPKRIGVVTSPMGAAVRDIIKVVRTRCPVVSILIAPARVQGPGSAIEIANAIRLLDERDVDVIIVGRGGGSMEDLWAFNEEIVARAIFASKHPVISAVGHESDVSISDYVADLRAATPSAGAERAVPDLKALNHRVNVVRERMVQGLVKWVEFRREKIRQLKIRLGDPREYIKKVEKEVFNLMERLNRSILLSVERKKNELVRFKEILTRLSPYSILNRGYSIVSVKGKVVANVSEISLNDVVDIKFAKGSAGARIEDIKD